MLQECSLFYTKRFCIQCVKADLELFPAEIRAVRYDDEFHFHRFCQLERCYIRVSVHFLFFNLHSSRRFTVSLFSGLQSWRCRVPARRKNLYDDVETIETETADGCQRPLLGRWRSATRASEARQLTAMSTGVEALRRRSKVFVNLDWRFNNASEKNCVVKAVLLMRFTL